MRIGEATSARGLRIALTAGAMIIGAPLHTGCRRVNSNPVSASQPPPASAPSFTDIAGASGLNFSHVSGATGGLLLPEVMGSGCALLDYDNDGDLDILLLSGHAWNDTSARSGGSTTRLYRRDANDRFTNVTDQSGLNGSAYAMGVAVGDYDNDGFADLLITNFGAAALYHNSGNGTFADATSAAGVAIDGWSASAAFLDIDRDGYLDLYVTRYLKLDPARACPDRTGRNDYCIPRAFEPLADVLLHNNGRGGFTDVSSSSGIAAIAAHGLGVVCEDFNGDGWIDMFVANDGDANMLWMNQRDGTFQDEAIMRGVAYSLHGRPEAGMGAVAADFDGDGLTDLFVTHLRTEFNRMYRRTSPLQAAPDFIDVTNQSRLYAGGSRCTGFGTAAADMDLDGDIDLLVANGRVTRAEARPDVRIKGFWREYAEPNQLCLNDGSGQFTIDTIGDEVEVSRGLAMGDIDADGDLDVLITNTDGPARLYRNDLPSPGRHWLLINAVDPRLNRDALGATLIVRAGNRRWTRTITSAFSYLSSSPPTAHVGLGDANRVDQVEVSWPDGLHERFVGVPVDQAVTLRRGEGTVLP